MLVDAIFPRGLMSLMGMTCVGLGGSPVWLGRVTCPPGVGDVTPPNQKWGTGHVTVAETEVGVDQVIGVEPEE